MYLRIILKENTRLWSYFNQSNKNMNLFIYCFSVLLLIYCQTTSIFVVKGGLTSESFSTWLVTRKKCAKSLTVSNYSEVPNRRACSLRLFRFSLHPARNFSCDKRKIPPCSFINYFVKKQAGWNFFSNPARFFGSARLLGTSVYYNECLPALMFIDINGEVV